MKKKFLILLLTLGLAASVYYSLKKSFDGLIDLFGDDESEDSDDLGL